MQRIAAKLGVPCRPCAAKNVEGFRISHAQQIRNHWETARFRHLDELIGHRSNVLEAIDFRLT
jgi:hypothetical protein